MPQYLAPSCVNGCEFNLSHAQKLKYSKKNSHTQVNALWARQGKRFQRKTTVSFEETVVSEGLKHAEHPPDKNVQRQVFQQLEHLDINS